MQANQQYLVEDNINLVYFLIHKYYPTFAKDEDVIQSGMLGLCKAADTWDENRAKFTTYAGKCIRNEINQEFVRRKAHSKNISLETKVGEDSTLGDMIPDSDAISYIDDGTFYKQLSKEEREVLSLDNVGYSTEEIAEKMGRSIQKIQKTLRIIRLKWRAFDAD